MSLEEEDNEEEEEDGDSKPFSSSEDHNQDVDTEDNIVRSRVDPEDYQQLLTKCLSALDLKDKPKEEGTSNPLIHPNNTLWGSRDYFPKKSSTEMVFPFPIFFKQQLKTEWETPAMTRRPPPSIRKLYSLPRFTNDFLKVPPVDAPILAL